MTASSTTPVNASKSLWCILLTVSIGAGVPVVPSLAQAAPAEESAEDRAMEAFARGTELYNAAKYEEALVSFEEAATLYASPDFQYNIALCYERLEKLEQAVRHYNTYLRTADDVPDRANIEAKVKSLEKRLEEEGSAPDETDPEPGPEPDPEPESGKKKKPGLPLIATGSALLAVGGLGAIGAGVGLGVVVGSKNDELDAVVNGGNPDGLTFDEAQAIEDEARGLQTGQIIAVSVGGALAVTGVALLVVGLRQKKKAQEGGDESAQVRVAPAFGPDGAGITLQGRF